MRAAIFFLLNFLVVPCLADHFYANFRSDLGPLPKTAKQRLHKEPDFRFKAQDWDEAIHTGQTWLGSERETSQGSMVTITGVEIREVAGRGRGCVMGDMVVSGVTQCPKPAWKGSPLLKARNPAGIR